MDPSWCPACDKRILPKRIVVPVGPPPTRTAPIPTEPPSPTATRPLPPPPASTPVAPSSPEVRKKHLTPRRIHPYGGGLLHGTGRVKPGGGLRSREDSRKHITPPRPAQDTQVIQGNPTAYVGAPVVAPPALARSQRVPPPAPQAPPARKTRVIISQDPTPLYCSDECRMRDLKNSFLESDGGFAGALPALDGVAKDEFVQASVAQSMSRRADLTLAKSGRCSSTSVLTTTTTRRLATRATSASALGEAYPLPIPAPLSRLSLPPSHPAHLHPTQVSAPCADADVDTTPPVPPNSPLDTVPPLCATSSSLESTPESLVEPVTPPTTGTITPPGTGSDSKTSTIRASTRKQRPRLPRCPSALSATSAASAGTLGTLAWGSPSHPTWGSPSKAALAPPKRTLFTVLTAGNGSVSSSLSSVSSTSTAASGNSALFEDAAQGGAETCGTTPSRRGSGGSTSGSARSVRSAMSAGSPSGGTKKKRVSFASDVKPPVAPSADAVPGSARRADWRHPRPRNPLLDANPLRDAISVSPRDRIVRTVSLPSDMPPAYTIAAPAPATTQSSPALHAHAQAQVVDPAPPRQPYRVAMWPEDAKRTTESSRVHGELLRAYAKRFAPREGRSLVCGRLWASGEAASARAAAAAGPVALGRRHEMQPDSRQDYWRAFEEREAEARATRRAERVVQRAQEEQVIGELLGGAGMRDEDQPQARRMKRMAYDGTPGPAEARGLHYRFDRFLYDVREVAPTVVRERVVRRWEGAGPAEVGEGLWVEEVVREEVVERKKLFNFEED